MIVQIETQLLQEIEFLNAWTIWDFYAMSTKICMHCHVRGRVQGVAFRYYTHKEAQKLGITGWAKNLKDGRVEVLACGEASAVEKLTLWLHQGPPAARVEEVNCTKADNSLCPNDFTVG